MPELPEVETVIHGLRAKILHKKIEKVTLFRKNLRFDFPEKFAENLKNSVITDIQRRAKYILIFLSNDMVLLSHLGMSGQYDIYDDFASRKNHKKHEHVHIIFTDKTGLVYTDARRFGFMDLFSNHMLGSHKLLKNIGVEPFSNHFNGQYLFDYSKKHAKISVKSMLMDQKCIAGMGNIYCCEALFTSGISPFKTAATLTIDDAENIASSSRLILKQAIEAGGSSLRDFQKTDGSLGYFQHAWQCYGRDGDKCVKDGCNGTIMRVMQNGRSSFYCSEHQK